ncbi:MAG: GNAT family N-acetyltransferase [Candidatus Manganitrophus sp. SB1]|nr:GNAT family N-acetyltransferase [Candidatus Manganitrophus morganii]
MVEIIDRLEDLRILATSWNKIAEPFGNPLLRHEWFVACAEAFCPPQQLSIVVVRSKGKTTAAAPLVSVRQKGIERLELLGCSFLFEPGGFIYEDPAALEELVDGIVALKRPLRLRRVSSSAEEIRRLRERSERHAYSTVKETEASLWLSCKGGWSEFESALSSSRRACFRRAKRRAEAEGKVQFEMVSPDAENVDRYLEELLVVETAGWKGQHGTALRLNEPLKRFFYLYAQAAARLGLLRLGFFRMDEKAIASMLAIEYADRLWVLKTGYDEVWARCSPGALLMHEMIRYAFEQGLEGYEFLGIDEPWLRIWTDQAHSYVSTRLYPYSLKGLFGLGLDLSYQAAGKVMRRFK